MRVMAHFFAFGPPFWTIFRNLPFLRSFLTLKQASLTCMQAGKCLWWPVPCEGGPPPVGILLLPWPLHLLPEKVHRYYSSIDTIPYLLWKWSPFPPSPPSPSPSISWSPAGGWRKSTAQKYCIPCSILQYWSAGGSELDVWGHLIVSGHKSISQVRVDAMLWRAARRPSFKDLLT